MAIEVRCLKLPIAQCRCFADRRHDSGTEGSDPLSSKFIEVQYNTNSYEQQFTFENKAGDGRRVCPGRCRCDSLHCRSPRGVRNRPMGTGKLLGLTDLAAASAEPIVPAAIADATIMPVLEPSQGNEAPKVKGALIARPSRYNVDSREITLAPTKAWRLSTTCRRAADWSIPG